MTRVYLPNGRLIRSPSDYSIMEYYRTFLKGRDMGFLDPNVGASDGNLQDVYAEGEPFTILKQPEIVKARTDYGEGEMVIVTVATDDGEKRLSIWGSYLVAQARDSSPGDFPVRVAVVRGAVEGFSDRPDTKRFQPVQ